MIIDEVGPVLKPGKVKPLSIKIDEMKDLYNKVRNLEVQLARTGLFDETFEKEVQALKAAINRQIQDLQAQLKQRELKAYAPFYNFWKKNVETNCSEILPVFKKTKSVLLRGTRRAPSDEFVGRSQEDRTPKDSSKAAQTMFDLVQSHLGIEALRSNSIFATSSYSHAFGYGTVYIILPINGFKFSYTKQRDVILDSSFDLVNHKIIKKISKLVEKSGKSLRLYGLDTIFKYNTGETYLLDSDPDDVLNKLKKDPLLGKDPFIKSLTSLDLVDVAGIKKNYAPTNKNLSKGLLSENEICINGSYYAFNFKKYNKLISEMLGFKI